MHQFVVTGILIGMVGVGCVQAQAQEPAPAAAGHRAVEQRPRRIEDSEAIRELLITYGRDFDKRDFAAYANLFAKDGVWVGGAHGSHPYAGPAAIQEFATKTYPPNSYPGSFHVMSSMSIHISGENTATAWSRWTYMILGGPHDEPTPFAAGYYEDALVREAGSWKFKRRQVFAAAPPVK